MLEPLGELSVKGRDKPVEAWRLVCPQTATQAAPLTPLVGRDEEVGHLQAVIDELTNGRGQMLFLLGDAGIGKTRLLAELRQLATERVTWLEGRCLSYGALPVPLVQMLRGWVGSEEGEPELSVRTKARAKLGLLPESELPNVLPSLGPLLNDPEDEERRSLAGGRGIRAPTGRGWRPRAAGARRRGGRGRPLGRPLDPRAGRARARAHRPVAAAIVQSGRPRAPRARRPACAR